MLYSSDDPNEPPIELLRLYQIDDIEPEKFRIRLDKAPKPPDNFERFGSYLRRWDQQSAGKTVVTEDGFIEVDATKPEGILTLESGLEFEFESPDPKAKAGFRRGDDWLIPARSALGVTSSKLYLPRSRHFFAPLCIAISEMKVIDCRKFFPAATPAP
jgi:hypothetical protein